MTSALPLVTSFPRPTTSALSLGPLGAALSPGQEYAGLYPPPFGPHADSPSRLGYPVAAGDAVPLPDVPVTADACEDALAGWHLQRLTHLAQGEGFADLGMMAFETVPVLREVRAIRRALDLFARGRPAGEAQKPAYVSLVFPKAADGEGVRFPDAEMRGKGLAEQVDELVEAVFGEGPGMADIGGVGVNCTSPIELGAVVIELSRAASERAHLFGGKSKPWFALCESYLAFLPRVPDLLSADLLAMRLPLADPDGGSVYDVVTRTWSTPHGMNEEKWAELLANVVGGALESGAWGGVLAGGCCKATPGAIGELRRVAEGRGWVPKRG